MNKKREIIYLVVIGILLLTITGMYFYPKSAPEPIVYNSTSDAAAVSPTDDGITATADDVTANDSGDYIAPFITPDSNTSSSQSKPIPQPKTTSQPTPGKVQAGQTKININTASLAELQRLPGVGAATAQKIVNYRNSHGNFAKIEDIMNVSGIATAKFNAMKDMISVN